MLVGDDLFFYYLYIYIFFGLQPEVASGSAPVYSTRINAQKGSLARSRLAETWLLSHASALINQGQSGSAVVTRFQRWCDPSNTTIWLF